MLRNIGAPEIIIIAVLLILILGWKRLPDAARSLGRSMRVFKSEVNEMKQDGKSAASGETVKGETVQPRARRRAASRCAASRSTARCAAPARSARTTARARTTPPAPPDRPRPRPHHHPWPSGVPATPTAACRWATTCASCAAASSSAPIALVARGGARLVPLRPGLRPPDRSRCSTSPRTAGTPTRSPSTTPALTAAFSQHLSIAIFVGVIVSQPGLALPALGVHRPRADEEGAARLAGLHRRDRPAVPRRLLVRLRRRCPRRSRCSSPSPPTARSTTPRPSQYFSFVTRFILVFGVSFVIPVFLVALNVIHVLPASGHAHGPGARRSSSSSSSRPWRRPRPDPFTMFLLAIPLCLLYLARDRRRDAHRPSPGEVQAAVGRRLGRPGLDPLARRRAVASGGEHAHRPGRQPHLGQEPRDGARPRGGAPAAQRRARGARPLRRDVCRRPRPRARRHRAGPRRPRRGRR